MRHTFTRRAMARMIGAAAAVRVAPTRVQARGSAFGYPMGLPGRPLGDGVLIRHGYAVENIPHYPGWWHTGENWHAAAGDTAGLGVYAVADGEVVYAGYDYPGRVVIIAHAPDLYSMYGHLDYTVAVEPGQDVRRGHLLGTVLLRSDEPARSHLHFELRTFFTSTEINGSAPRYGVSCGYECPPGPGYWPMAAPEHPSALGWRNPTHVINRRAWPDGVPDGATVVVSHAAPASTPLWSAPTGLPDAAVSGALRLAAGDRHPLLAIATGAEEVAGTSAEAYFLWYRIALPASSNSWVQAAVPDAAYVGADGRPAAVRLDFVPDIATPAG